MVGEILNRINSTDYNVSSDELMEEHNNNIIDPKSLHEQLKVAIASITTLKSINDIPKKLK